MMCSCRDIYEFRSFSHCDSFFFAAANKDDVFFSFSFPSSLNLVSVSAIKVMPQNTCFRQNPWALLHSTRLCKMMELNNFHRIQFKFLHLSFQNVLNSFFQLPRRPGFGINVVMNSIFWLFTFTCLY